MTEKCQWQRPAEDDNYETSCKKAFYLVDGTLSDEFGFKWCPYCGLEIEPLEPKECVECGSEHDEDGELCYLCEDDRQVNHD